MKRLHTICIALLAALLAGCSVPKSSHMATSGTPKRIVSLAPSVTEILYAVGAGDRVVATDDYSNYPPAAKAKPHIGGVVTNYEKIVSLKPDLVIGVADLQGSALDRLRRLGLDVLAIDTTSYDKTIAAIRQVGKAVGEPEGGERAAGRLEKARDFARRMAQGAKSRSVLFVAQAAPSVIVAGQGTFQDDLLRIIGARNAAPVAGFSALSRETMARIRPDLVLVGSKEEAAAMRKRFAELPGPDPRVEVMPEDILVRPGPRLGDGLRWLVGQLHGQASPR